MGKREKNRIESECKKKVVEGLWKKNLWKEMLMCEQAGYNWKGSNYIYIFDEWLCDIVQPLNRVQLFVTPWTAAHQVSFFTVSWNLLRFVFIELMTLSNHLIPCRPLLLLPSIFPSTAVFSNELALRIRWWKHWSFSISPSSEYSGLILSRLIWSPCCPRDSEESSPAPQFKSIHSLGEWCIIQQCF